MFCSALGKARTGVAEGKPSPFRLVTPQGLIVPSPFHGSDKVEVRKAWCEIRWVLLCDWHKTPPAHGLKGIRFSSFSKSQGLSKRWGFQPLADARQTLLFQGSPTPASAPIQFLSTSTSCWVPLESQKAAEMGAPASKSSWKYSDGSAAFPQLPNPGTSAPGLLNPQRSCSRWDHFAKVPQAGRRELGLGCPEKPSQRQMCLSPSFSFFLPLPLPPPLPARGQGEAAGAGLEPAGAMAQGPSALRVSRGTGSPGALPEPRPAQSPRQRSAGAGDGRMPCGSRSGQPRDSLRWQGEGSARSRRCSPGAAPHPAACPQPWGRLGGTRGPRHCSTGAGLRGQRCCGG